MNKDNEQLHIEILKTMSKEQDWQIVERFNSNLQNMVSNELSSLYISVFKSEFDKRGIDYSRIGDSQGLSLKRKVVLISNVLFPIYEKLTDFSKEQVQIMLEDFMRKTHPDLIKYHPKIISFDDSNVLFGMQKHFGRLWLSSSSLYNQKNQMITATDKEFKCILISKSFAINSSVNESVSKDNSRFYRLEKSLFGEDEQGSSSVNKINDYKSLVSIKKTLKELWNYHGPDFFVNIKSKLDCLSFWVKELHGIEGKTVFDLEKKIRKSREEILANNIEMLEKYEIENLINFREIELEIIDEIDMIYGDYNP